MAEVTVRSTDQVPTLQLSPDGTAATGTLNARCDSSGYLKVNVAAGGGSSTVNLTQVGGSAIALGQAAMAASLPVAIASNQSNVPTNLVQYGGTNVGAANAVHVQPGTSATFVLGTGSNTIGALTANQSVNLAQYSGSATGASNAIHVQPGTSATFVLGTGSNTIGALTANQSVNLAQVGGASVSTAASGIAKVGITDSSGNSITRGSQTSANSLPVVIASDQGAVTQKAETVSAFSQQLTVSVGNTATQLLASNASRKSFIIVNNDASTDCYWGNGSVVSGATAQANGGLLIVKGGGSYSEEGPTVYTGVVSAITASGTAIVSVQER